MAGHIYLRKANDDLISHCKCDPADALISSPGQMDCPWCGCGWLFICSRCRKAFTFAEGVVIDEPWSDTGARLWQSPFGREPEPGEVEEWIDFMKMFTYSVQVGAQYVYLDGYAIPTTAGGVEIEGIYGRHDLQNVPQVAARANPDLIDGLLGSNLYWQANRINRPEL